MDSTAKAKTIFLNALDLSSAEERRAFIDAQCGQDDMLRREVEELLRHDADAGSFLKSPVLEGDTATFAPASELCEMQMGPYKLLQQIGEGGFGFVYMAEQTQPVQRCVALKILKPGIESRQVIRRFETERQALAVLDHPNIAKVLDAGTSDSGQPYFVMELVEGVPITEYCDEHQLTPRQRLELFLPVCHAVQHAHQKGIIHRDIKPTNVLVAPYDGRPVPKVIDFGVAKATAAKPTDCTVFTELGQIVGTLEYMSPEQAELNQVDIDTRTDIYSLGVLLYELLTGTTPFARKRLHDAGLMEMLRIIREEEPSKPSVKLSTIDELPSVAARRRMEPRRLSGLVRGELDWIVMKALEKDRNRRYETGNALAMDIQRYLNDEPVLASPPSALYRFRKFARRNRVALTTATIIALTLVLGTLVSTWQAIRARRAERDAVSGWTEEAQQRQQVEQQRNRAVDAEGLARSNEQKARDAELKAQDEERKAKHSESEARAVLEFFQQKVLAGARPTTREGGLGVNVTVREAIDAAESSIGTAFQDEPIVEASIRSVLGQTYWYLGEADLAIRQHKRAGQLRSDVLGPDHLETIASVGNLAAAYKAAGKLDQALRLCDETLEKRKAKLGPDHLATLSSVCNLAGVYHAAGKFDHAQRLYNEAREKLKATVGPDHPNTLEAMAGLAKVYLDSGKLDLALPILEDITEKRQAKLGPDHLDTIDVMNSLACAYVDAGKPDQALPLLKETWGKRKAKLGPDHPSTLRSMQNLAGAHFEAGQFQEAMPLFEETLEKLKAKLGPEHHDTLAVMFNLAYAYQAAGQLGEAEPLFREAVTGARRSLGLGHYLTQHYLRNLADCYAKLHQPNKAEPLWRELAAFWKETAGAESPKYAGSLASLGLNLLEQQKPTDAELLLRECLLIREKKAPDDWNTFDAKSLLGISLLRQQKYADAEPLLCSGYYGMKKRELQIPRENARRLTAALERVIELYTVWNEPDEVAKWRAMLSPPTPPVLVNSQSGRQLRDITIGPDGNLYVASKDTNQVVRLDGETGEFLDVFVAEGHGLIGPKAMVFGPDGKLYVAGVDSHNVLRYDGSTGAFLDEYITAHSAGLHQPKGLAFGPDGHLYISSSTGGGGIPGPHQVLRFQGPGGSTPGAPLPGARHTGAVFVDDGAGGLSHPNGLAFGPDGNLYVASTFQDCVNRYNGTTGEFLDVFVPNELMDGPSGLAFHSDGCLYVASGSTGHVLRCDEKTGAFRGALGGGNELRPSGLVFDAHGRLYVTCGNTNQVFRFDLAK